MEFYSLLSIVTFLFVFVGTMGIFILPFVNATSFRSRGFSSLNSSLISLTLFLCLIVFSGLLGVAMTTQLENLLSSLPFFQGDTRHHATALTYTSYTVVFGSFSLPHYIFAYLLNKKKR